MVREAEVRIGLRRGAQKDDGAGNTPDGPRPRPPPLLSQSAPAPGGQNEHFTSIYLNFTEFMLFGVKFGKFHYISPFS